MERICVRRGTSEDVCGLSRLMDLNGLPLSVAAEEMFLVAESGGEVVAALEYRFGRKGLSVGRLIADPSVEERPLAEALYREARVFARRADLREVAASSSGRGDYLRRAGYRWRGGGLFAAPVAERSASPSAGVLRRVIELWGTLPVPFFRVSGE